jgi:hypothetical protein
METYLGFGMLGVIGLFLALICLLMRLLSKAVYQITETNKQLLIVVAGKDEKPESALRALVALNKPPQGKLRGIADGKKDKKEPENTNYIMSLGN